MTVRRVAMGFLFYPRGGSAQVVRYLAGVLPDVGWEASVFCGSLGPPGTESNAKTFFAGLDVHAADFGPALEAAERGADPLAAEMPLHPSFEDRPGAPDRVLAAVEPHLLERQVAAWTRVLEDGGAGGVECFHLQHLTPQYEVVARRWPGHPVVGHLHGTELKMLDAIERGAPWPHAAFWAETMRRWAHGATQLLVISPHDRDEAVRRLGVPADRIRCIPNGVDTDRFTARALPVDERLQLLRRWLVDEPRGWDEGGDPGGVRYTVADLERFVDPGTGALWPVLLFVGRFLGFKRVPLLIRAYARARSRFSSPAPLVIWGGHPGEWEGEHPVTVARDEGVADHVFFVGWRGHDDLPSGLACADAMVAPSVDESFGQVFIEAMACGVPVVTTSTGGPLAFVNTEPGRPNGWLVPPDDEAALAGALVELVTQPDERRRRGRHAYEQARAGYSWRALASRFASCYEEVTAPGAAGARGAP